MLGAYITQNGGKIDLIDRNKAHVSALKKNGAKMTGTVEIDVPITAPTPDEMNGKYDVVLLLNKDVVTPQSSVFRMSE